MRSYNNGERAIWRFPTIYMIPASLNIKRAVLECHLFFIRTRSSLVPAVLGGFCSYSVLKSLSSTGWCPVNILHNSEINCPLDGPVKPNGDFIKIVLILFITFKKIYGDGFPK
jgi:hypothetical protein